MTSMQITIPRRLTLAVLGVGVSLVGMGFQPADQRPGEDQEPRPAVQKRSGPKVVQVPLDDDSIRVRLLMVEMVQKDLGLTADQIGKLKDLAKTSEGQSRDVMAKLREIFPPSQSFTPEEFDARKPEFQALLQAWISKGKELRAKALATLTPSQNERLQQIQLQETIPTAMTRPEIVKALGISEGQLAEIQSLRDQMNQKQLADWPHLDDLGPKERGQKVIELMKRSNEAQADTTKRILNLLTPEQRTKLEKLQGKKIDVNRLRDALVPKDVEF